MKLRRSDRPKPKANGCIIRWRSPIAMGDIEAAVEDIAQFEQPVIRLNMQPDGISHDVYLEAKQVKRLHQFLGRYLDDL